MLYKRHRYLWIQSIAILFVLLITALYGNSVSAQNTDKKTRILFVLDGSGSMAGKWEGKTKFEIARDLLVHSIDSIEQADKNVQFGLRVFGHQFPRDENNCKDSKLEIDFAPNNAQKIRSKLAQITIQGQTPIAYSLFEAANDFKNDGDFKNVIVLITDGVETCEGDPCAIAEELKKHRITLKPFIIGLGMGEAGKNYFDCVGTYYDAQDKLSFNNVLDVVISQAINNTTAQVNLLDIHGNATETNVEMVFYDAFSGKIHYTFVHSMNNKNMPDTIYLNPVGKYNLTVHTTPAVHKKNIELNPGKHNIIAVNAPQGQLVLKQEGYYGFSDVQALIRQAGKHEILDVQSLNTRKKLLVGNYDLEILTLPRTILKNVTIEQSIDKEVHIAAPGTLNLEVARPGIASIYYEIDGKLELVFEIDEISGKYNLALQPGEYTVIYRPNKFMSSELTQQKIINIYSKGQTNLKF